MRKSTAGNLTTLTPPVPLAPEITITDPGPALAGPNAVLQVMAKADPGLTIQHVQFKWQGNSLGAPVTASPYCYQLDTTTIPDGLYDLDALTVDSAGKTVAATTAKVTVRNPPPTVEVKMPAGAAVVSGASVALEAKAAPGASMTLTGVEFFVDGNKCAAVAGTGPFTSTF